ncbi:973_t:CDS:1 [Acaulospora morrowiae]|uniref:973_t:CDS:1 n=1 Tax=Acaulospora morrowiae TaxID=94023 RepID=A0A9N9I1Y6_9GLOM|nr:973_t:CDS:1 [Acaulospora morrowiae]
METSQIDDNKTLNNLIKPIEETIDITTLALENMQIKEQGSDMHIEEQGNNIKGESVSDSEIYLIVSRRHGRKRRIPWDGGRRIGLQKVCLHHFHKDLNPHRGLGSHVEHGFGRGNRGKHGFGHKNCGKHGFGHGHRGKHVFGFGHRREHGIGLRGKHDIPEIIRIKCDKRALDVAKLDETDEVRKNLEIRRLKGRNRHVIKNAHGHRGRLLRRRSLRLRSLSPLGYNPHGKCGITSGREIRHKGFHFHVHGSFGKNEREDSKKKTDNGIISSIE